MNQDLENARKNVLGKSSDFSFVYSSIELSERLTNLEHSIPIADEHQRFGCLVNPSTNQTEPFHRWARYREAYSGKLVKELIRRSNLNPLKDFILDPMCGSGSTLVASAQMGFDCLGLDILPYSVDLSNAKVEFHSQETIDQIQNFVRRPVSSTDQQTSQIQETPESWHRYFRSDHFESLSNIRSALEKVPNQKARNLLFVAWLAILEDCSERRKEGNGLATRKTKVFDVWSHFVSKVKLFLEDICNYGLPQDITAFARKASAFKACSLSNEFQRKVGKKLGAVIFSPPYANSFDYFESYKLELLAGYYDAKGLIAARKEAIRNYRKGYGHPISSKNELVRLLCDEVRARLPRKETKMGRADNRSRLIPNLLVGYFEDMEKVFQELSSCMPKGSYCYVVVNQSSYLGVVIPTDLLLADIAGRFHLSVTNLIACGKATTSAQQLREYPYLHNMLRASIVCLRNS